MLGETHLLVDAVGPHVGVVEAALGVHVLGHDGHPVGQALGAAPRPGHASPGPAPGLGVAPTSECRLLQSEMLLDAVTFCTNYPIYHRNKQTKLTNSVILFT